MKTLPLRSRVNSIAWLAIIAWPWLGLGSGNTLNKAASGSEMAKTSDEFTDGGEEGLRKEGVRGTKAGEIRTVDLGDGVTLELVWIPAGTFVMGSPPDEIGRMVGLEDPQRRVTLSRGFWMGKTPVTQAQYQLIMGRNPSRFKNAGTNAPVESVTWGQAKEFCEKLQERLSGDLGGLTARLPNEAEWEYACRAGTTSALYSGKELTTIRYCPNLAEIAWYSGNSGGQTRPVGQKTPNAWGLHDMLGNVWEWCAAINLRDEEESVTNPQGLRGAGGYTVRGGDWSNAAGVCRSACRINYHDIDADLGIGFRVVVQ